MHYQILVPGVSGASASHLNRVVGLNAPGAEWDEVSTPFGNGMLASWRTGDSSDAPRIFCESFRWIRGPGDQEYYYGVDPDNMPSPTELARKQQLRGRKVQLGDGREWLVPSATYLPARNGINWKTREFERRVESEYEDFSRQASEYAMQFFQKEEQIALLAKTFGLPDLSKECVQIPLENAWTHSTNALSLNYRVNAELADILNLLDDSSIISVCCATFDLQLIIEAVKKNSSPSPIGIPAGQTL